jgi:hypothetical protein
MAGCRTRAPWCGNLTGICTRVHAPPFSVGSTFKIIEIPGITVILYEAIHSYLQIFTDGCALPKDPSPTQRHTSSTQRLD